MQLFCSVCRRISRTEIIAPAPPLVNIRFTSCFKPRRGLARQAHSAAKRFDTFGTGHLAQGALSELEAHQLIYRRQGSGTYVAPLVENTDRVLDSVPTIGLIYNREFFDARSSPAGSLLVEEANDVIEMQPKLRS